MISGTRDQIANNWIIEKAREFQKNICFIDYAKAFDCVGHKECGKELDTTERLNWTELSFRKNI